MLLRAYTLFGIISAASLAALTAQAQEQEEVPEPEPEQEEEPQEAQAREREQEQAAQEPEREAELGIRGTTELGFIAVLAHEIRLGNDGDRIDYPGDMAQSNLYLSLRATVDVDIWRQHIITLVYQPLEIESRATLPRTLRIDGLDYAQGTPVRARYSFPFYRFGWAFDVLSGRNEELAFGLGLQIRNAAIEFESEDGAQFRARNDVGPVPLLRTRGRFEIAAGWFFAFEVDGFYAFIPGLNGSDTEVEGAIVDASVRLGWRLMPHVDAFLNVRYLGGGAEGEGDPNATSDGYQSNWLHFLAVSLGATIDSRP
jgi:hypothetical protein